MEDTALVDRVEDTPNRRYGDGGQSGRYAEWKIRRWMFQETRWWTEWKVARCIFSLHRWAE